MAEIIVVVVMVIAVIFAGLSAHEDKLRESRMQDAALKYLKKHGKGSLDGANDRLR